MTFQFVGLISDDTACSVTVTILPDLQPPPQAARTAPIVACINSRFRTIDTMADMDVDMAPPVKKEKAEPAVGKDSGKQRFEVKKVNPSTFPVMKQAS